MNISSWNKLAVLFAIVTTGGTLCQLQAAQAQSASVQPSQTGAPTSDVNTTVVELQFSELYAVKGVFAHIRHKLGSKIADSDQLFNALKSGSRTSYQCNAAADSGEADVCYTIVQVSYKHVPWNGPGAIDGQSVLFQPIRTEIAATPTVEPNGTCHLSVTITRTDVPNKSKPGVKPATSTQRVSVETSSQVGETVLLADLKPKRGFGRNFEEMVFVTIVSIKRT